MLNKSTKTRLLDAAELLFATHGFHNTSLRAITAKAGANLAAVNYHFGCKEALMAAVLERRLIPLNTLRLQRLDQVATAAAQNQRRPAVRDILLAFIAPTLKFKESSGGAKNFITLIGRAITEPDDPIKTKFIEMIGPLIFRVFTMLCEALPLMPRETLHTRLFFALGGLSHAMMMDGRWPTLDPAMKTRHDAKTLIAQLVPFIAAGLEATP